MTAKLLTLPLLCLGLAACGDNDSSSGSTGGPSQAHRGSFAQMAANGQRLEASYGTAPLTAASAMPTSGSARYAGNAAFGSGDDILASVDMNARFTATGGTIGGEMSNFRAYDNSRIGGTVAIQDADFTAGNSFTNQLSGTLDYQGTSAGVTGAISSDFVGGRGQAVRGSILADVVGQGRTSGRYGAELVN